MTNAQQVCSWSSGATGLWLVYFTFGAPGLLWLVAVAAFLVVAICGLANSLEFVCWLGLRLAKRIREAHEKVRAKINPRLMGALNL